MKKLHLLIALILIISGCNGISQNKNVENPINKNILGEWDLILPIEQGRSNGYIWAQSRFVFLNDSTYEDANGFYEMHNNKPLLVAATRTYKIEGDQLLDYNEENSIWEPSKIVKCNKDSLEIETNGKIYSFTRAITNGHGEFDFDEVVLNTYPCTAANCPTMAISVNKNGNVFLQKISISAKDIKREFFKSATSKFLFASIQRKVNRAAINALNNKYKSESGAFDIVITFYKKGKVQKSITDIGSASTKELFWLYNFLSHFDQLLDLEKVKREDFTYQFEKLDFNTVEKIKGQLKSHAH